MPDLIIKTKQISFPSFLSFLILIGFFISCKSGSAVSTDKTIEKDSISKLAYPSEEIRINPDEAIITVLINSIIKLDNGQRISCKLIKIEKRGFGFSSNLIEGDLVIINNATKSQINKINEEVRCIINETESLGQNYKTFGLIQLL